MKLSIFVRLAGLAAMAVFGATSTSAQTLGTGIPLNQQDAKTQEQIEKQKAIEEAYKATLRKIPDAKQSNDPWGGVREAETSKTTQAKAKPAPKKTGSAAN
jgi:hypothetical protein